MNVCIVSVWRDAEGNRGIDVLINGVEVFETKGVSAIDVGVMHIATHADMMGGKCRVLPCTIPGIGWSAFYHGRGE